MKRDMITCIRAISGEDFDTLEDIIENKYHKFCSVYRLISSFSDFITSLSYKDREKKNSLKIELRVSGIPTKKVFGEIEDEIQRSFGDGEASIELSGRTMIIEVLRDE